MKKQKNGFTLLEVIVVSGLIALGAAIVLANTDAARAKGRDTRRVADLQQIQKALSLYQTSNNNNVPANADDLVVKLVGPYLSELPRDPQTREPYVYIACNGSYHLGAELERADDRRLATDADDGASCGAGDFHGKSADCVANVPASTEKCFDIKP